MSDSSITRQRQQLLGKFLAGQIDKATYDALLAELQELHSASVVSESLIVERSSEPPEVIIATSDPRSQLPKSTPVALVERGIELGGFRIEKRLGRGGMGEVWQAQDLVGERTVVIKLLHPEFVHHPDEVASVKQMFQHVHNLQHQNICPLYVLGQDSRFGYYVVMKFIDGQTLSLYRREFIATHGRFSLRDVARVLAPVAKALDYAHQHKVVHCDVKPQNIMISRKDQSVQLVDFGLAAEIRSSVSRLSSSSVEYGGTYPYMSPEQWRGEIIDGKTDQYALAVVAYELLAGRRPFQSSDPAVLRMCVLNESPHPIEGIDSNVNEALLRGLAKAKSKRFDSCVAFMRTLCELIGTSDKIALGRERPAISPNSVVKASTTKPAPTDEDDEDLLELIESLDIRVQRGKRTQEPKTRRDSHDRSRRAETEPIESPIERANRQAVIWIGAAASICLMAFVALSYWLVTSPSDTPESSPPVRNSGLTTVSPSNSTTTTPAKPTSPIDDAVPRYHWQPGKAYAYAVNLDINQDADRVLSYSGDLIYSASSATGNPVEIDKETRGTGTAFVVHPDGYLLTCHHVTDAATEIEVVVSGKTYVASLVASNPEYDLALIHIDATGLPSLPLANSDSVQQGEEVIAIGFPLSSILGENIKATRGTISGINDDEGHKVFQIDAAINPGNSGGPLVNEKAEVIGIVYAKLVDNVATSVAFATPINAGKTLLNSKQIAYSQGRSGGKLDGPALVKEVSAATALVTVKSVEVQRSLNGKVALRCDGMLQPRSWRRSGLPGDAIDSQALSRQLVFSSTDAGSNVDQIETDALGRIHAMTGGGNLPSFLGQASRLIVETLPSKPQRTWSYSHPVTLTVEQNETNAGRQPWPPQFGPRHFGPSIRSRMPFGPLGREFVEVSKKDYPGVVRVDYVMGEKTEQRQTIHKTYELKTDELVGASPRVQSAGQGSFVIDLSTGLPQESEFSGTLTETEPNRSSTVPFKLTYKFREERKLLPGQSSPKAVPSPVVIPGQPVEAGTKLEIGSRLICDWAGKWLPVSILSLHESGDVRIHWEGWSDQWDEDVPRSRLRFAPDK